MVTDSRDPEESPAQGATGPGFDRSAGAQAGSGNVQVNYFYGKRAVPPGAHAKRRGRKPGSATRPKRARRIIVASAAMALAAATWAGIALPSKPSGDHEGQGRGTQAAPAPVGNASWHLAAILDPPGDAGLSTVAGAVAMSADGKYVAAAGASPDQSSVYVWNDLGGLQATLGLPAGGTVALIAFTPDDKALVVLCYSSSARTNTIYRVTLSARQKPRVIGTFPPSLNWAVSGDGNTLATVNSTDDGISLTNLSEGTGLADLQSPAAGLIPDSLQLDNNGKEMIISDTEGTAYVVNTGSETVLGSWNFKRTVTMPYPVLSPDGTTVLVPAAGNKVELWTVGSRSSNVTPRDPLWPEEIGGFLFSSDGGTIMTLPEFGISADLWGEATHAHILRISITNSQGYNIALLGPGGRQFAYGLSNPAGTAYPELYVYDIPCNAPTRCITG